MVQFTKVRGSKPGLILWKTAPQYLIRLIKEIGQTPKVERYETVSAMTGKPAGLLFSISVKRKARKKCRRADRIWTYTLAGHGSTLQKAYRDFKKNWMNDDWR